MKELSKNINQEKKITPREKKSKPVIKRKWKIQITYNFLQKWKMQIKYILFYIIFWLERRWCFISDY